MKIHIVNGPNLNLLGKREPDIYGKISFEEYFNTLQKKYSTISLSYFQSNEEGKLIDYIHKVGFDSDAIILNAGAFTHTSLALRDTISAVTTPVVEVHISNVYSRETFRHKSYLAGVCKGCLCGFGMEGYEMAISFFLSHKN